jgi:hypothetical protein
VIRLVAIAVLALGPMALICMAQDRCPRVFVSCVDTNGCEQPYSFLASVTNADPTQKISFEWSVFNGRIIAGQGTSVIKVVRNQVTRTFNRNGKLVTEVQDQGSLTASVKLVGASPDCKDIAASLTFVDESGLVPPVVLVEEFGNISMNDVKMRLDSFASRLRNAPGAMGYIISDGKWSKAKRAIEHLATKGINADRLRYVAGNKNTLLRIKLYLVPAGAVPPKW